MIRTPPADDPGADPSLGEQVSAWLDGELDPVAAADLQARIEADPMVRAERDSLARVRTLVRNLPAVEPPFGFYERMLVPSGRASQSRTTVVTAMVAVAATVLAFVIFAGLTPVGDRIVPPLEAFAERHDSLVSSPDWAEADAYVPVDVEGGEPQASVLPATLGSLPRMAAYAGPEATQVIYGREALVVSVFEQPRHSVDWTSMPRDGERLEVAGSPAWRGQRARHTVVVVERPAVVLTVVSIGPNADLDEVLDAIPMPGAPTVLDRVRSAGQQFARAFGLDA